MTWKTDYPDCAFLSAPIFGHDGPGKLNACKNRAVLIKAPSGHGLPKCEQVVRHRACRHLAHCVYGKPAPSEPAEASYAPRRAPIEQAAEVQAGFKLCSVCRQVLPISEYHKSKAKKDGLQRTCKLCTKKANLGFYYRRKAEKEEARRKRHVPTHT